MREIRFVGGHLSDRGILKETLSFIQRALYNGMDQGCSATLLECEGATRS
jgi:hypothetical protein